MFGYKALIVSKGTGMEYVIMTTLETRLSVDKALKPINLNVNLSIRGLLLTFVDFPHCSCNNAFIQY